MIDLSDTVFDRWKKYDKEYLNFKAVEPKFSSRSDIHAFILLNQLQPDTTDIIDAAEHDVIFLNIDVDKLMETITTAQLIELIRCGVRYDEENNSLSMFV